MPYLQFWNGVMVTPRGAPLAPYAPALGRGCHVGTSLASRGRGTGILCVAPRHRVITRLRILDEYHM